MPFEDKKERICLAYYIDVDSANEITEANALSLEFINKVSLWFLKLYNLIVKLCSLQ